jgi:hypothetical protein
VEPLYVARPSGLRWFNLIFLALLAIDAVLVAALLLLYEVVAAAVAGAGLLATYALFWLILPRRYELWPDRLRLAFAAWRWDIPYDSIEMVREGRWYEAYGFMGVRFATAPGQTVVVLRRNSNLFRRPDLVISPEGRDEFLRQIGPAISLSSQRMGSG